ncbi:MAG TPA: HAMP domain-containing sensor histidine kinase [Acidocella sp.]|nr:HAMP domain-containing sensor histidine kinase [Acidocella sp.]
MRHEAWPRQLLRSAGVRVALRSLALSLAGALLVFAIIHHAAENSWRGALDGSVQAALSDIQSDLRENRLPLAQNVRDTIAEGGGLFYADLGPDFSWRAGNLHLSPAVASGWSGFETLHAQPGLTLPRRVLAIRGLMWRSPSGEHLFIAANATPLLALDRLISRSFLLVFGSILAFGLLSVGLTAQATLKRVDGFATALQVIMDGDLSRRLPLQHQGDEFDRLAVEVNATLQRLQELMENLRQVTNDISHDLRSPLTRLREHLERSRQRFPAPALGEMFDEAIAQLDQALGIFTAMLRIAEVEAGARRARFQAVQLSALLAMLAESYEPPFSAAGIAITTAIEPGLVMQGDQELLTQLFANLLDNIALHAQGADKARIRASAAADRIELVFSDNGIGVPAHEQERVLQRFVRLDAARHRPGHGLGLPLARAIVALHGGSLRLGGGGGLDIIISLPAG